MAGHFVALDRIPDKELEAYFHGNFKRKGQRAVEAFPRIEMLQMGGPWALGKGLSE